MSTRARFVLGIFALLTNACFVPPSPPIDSTLIASPTDSTEETEPSVAVAPNGTVAIAWLEQTPFSPFVLGYAFSRDRGATWEPSQTLLLPEGRGSSNEIIQADALSNFYLVSLGVSYGVGVDGVGSSSNVLIAKAPAGETSFGAFTEVSDPKLTTAFRDASAFVIANDQSLNVVWTEYPDLANSFAASIVAARSTNGGRTWIRTAVTPANGAVAWPNLCASKTTGRVAAVFIDTATRATGMRWSEDSGATWPAANTNVIAQTEKIGEFPSCVQGPMDLWVMQGVSENAASGTVEPTLDDIQLTHSADGGPTLDAPVSVEDSHAASSFMRAMAVLRDDLSLTVLYYAGDGDDDPNGSVRTSKSVDRGKTFSPSEKLFGPIVLTTSRTGADWLGDLNGITADLQNTFFVYVDNSSGTAHVRFTRRY